MVYNAYITQSASYEGMISEDMICAGAPGKDSCQALSPILKHHHFFCQNQLQNDFFKNQGDSGGPFTVKNEETNQHDLVGVVSWGMGCAAVGLFLYHDGN